MDETTDPTDLAAVDIDPRTPEQKATDALGHALAEADRAAEKSAADKIATEEKKKGPGRPKGSGDLRPRKLRPSKQNPSGGAPKEKAKPSGGSPLSGSVDGDEQADKPRKPRPIKDVEDLFALPAAELSMLTVSMLNMIVVSQIAKRVGPIEASAVNLNSEEQGKIEKATTRVLEKYLPQLGCEWALAVTVAIIYTNKWSDVQLARAGVTREQAYAMAQAHAEKLKADADARQNGQAA